MLWQLKSKKLLALENWVRVLSLSYMIMLADITIMYLIAVDELQKLQDKLTHSEQELQSARYVRYLHEFNTFLLCIYI